MTNACMHVAAENVSQNAHSSSTWRSTLSTVAQSSSIMSNAATTAYHVATLAGHALVHSGVSAGGDFFSLRLSTTDIV